MLSLTESQLYLCNVFVSEVSFYLFYFQNCLNKFAHEMGEMLKYFNVSQSPSLSTSYQYVKYIQTKLL